MKLTNLLPDIIRSKLTQSYTLALRLTDSLIHLIKFWLYHNETLSVFEVEGVGGNADLKQKAGTRHQC